MTVAWGNLKPIEIAQLLHFRPDLRDEYENWKYGKGRNPENEEGEAE